MTRLDNWNELKKRVSWGSVFGRCCDGTGCLYLAVGIRFQHRSVYV